MFYNDCDIELATQNNNNYHTILQIKHLVNKLWVVLKNINEYLYHENTKTILLHKPVFDKEKHNLISIDNYIDNFYKIGLINKIDKNKKIKTLDNVFLNDITYSKEWNVLANNINKQIIIFNNIIKKEQRIEKFFNDNNNVNIKSQYCNLILNIFIFIGIIIIFIFFYNYIFQV
jgi:hypothetical protein